MPALQGRQHGDQAGKPRLIDSGRAFFDLQVRFAETISDRFALPREHTLLEYTNLYIRFGLGRDFDPAHPIWRAYLAGLRTTNDGGEWTYRFSLSRPDTVVPPGLVATFGCFSYARLSDDRIRLHFHNAEADGRSPLASDRQDARTVELGQLFAHAKRTVRSPNPIRVVGASWLYNLEAYRRLFPTSYVASARVLRGRFRHMPLWGQFVDRHGRIRDGAVGELFDRLARQRSVDDLDACFPFQVLGLEAPVDDFYACLLEPRRDLQQITGLGGARPRLAEPDGFVGRREP